MSTGRAVAALPPLLLAALLAGCGGSPELQDLERYVAEVQARQRPRIEPLPEFKPYETFLYEAEHLPDPFQAPSFAPPRAAAGAAEEGIRPDPNRPREALESYPLDSLRMVGTLGRGGESWALIAAPDETIHRLQPGNYLGQNHGRITRISEYEVELTEIIPDGLGGWRERQASLALSE